MQALGCKHPKYKVKSQYSRKTFHRLSWRQSLQPQRGKSLCQQANNFRKDQCGNILLAHAWKCQHVCVCARVSFEEKWVQLGLIRVQCVPLELSQTRLSFNMPFPTRIRLSHVTELDAHTSSSHPFVFLMLPPYSPPHPLCVPQHDFATTLLLSTTTTTTVSTTTRSSLFMFTVRPICRFLAKHFSGYFKSLFTLQIHLRVRHVLRRLKRGRVDYWNNLLERLKWRNDLC